MLSCMSHLCILACWCRSLSQWCLTLCRPLNSHTPGLRPPCPSPSPGACSHSCPSSRWCHPTISSSAVPFSSRLQSFRASGSFPVSQLFISGGQSVGASSSASVFPILDVNCSSLGLFTNILLHSEGCLFVWFMVPFSVQNPLSAIGSPLFSFASLSFGSRSQKILLWHMSESIVPMLSSRGFMASCLILMTLNHFEFVFVYVVGCPNFSDLHVAFQHSQHHSLKRLEFLYCISSSPLLKTNWP